MSTSSGFSSLAEELRSDQRRRWLSGERMMVERYLADHPSLSRDPRALVELAVGEFCLRQEIGETPDPSEYLARFPEQRDTLERMLETRRSRASQGADLSGQATQSHVRPGLTCPFCSRPLSEQPLETNRPIECDHCRKQVVVLDPTMTLAGEAVYSIGRFHLRERVGSGQFGDVWRGYDSDLRRDVAIKIPRRLPDDPSTRELFLREARAVARIRHPNVVPVYEVGRDGERVYIVSEFVRGPTLRQWSQHKRPTPDEAARLCRILALALEPAHQAGIVHRDLKPGNILLDEQGQPHITDFGIAKVSLDELTITPVGEVVGTPAYMSPEQARGDARQADARADIYSLGVVLYELLCGRRPFDGHGAVLIHQLLHCDPEPPSKWNRAIPKDLETICLKAMAKEPAARYPSAGAVAADLERYLKREPIEARRRGPLVRAWRWSRRNHVLAAMVIFLGGAMLIARPWKAEPGAPPPLMRRVLLETEPAGAAITLFPINPSDGEPLPHQRITFGETTPLKVDLPPGDYLVVAVLDAHGFQESQRHVPGEEEKIPWAYLHRQWEALADDTIRLPTIVIPNSTVNDNLVYIQGAEAFVMGQAGSELFPPESRKVPPFYIAPHEFTVGDHKRALEGRLPLQFKNNPPPDDTPLTEVDYDKAVHFAERAGMRLLTETEYEFAATARGARRFPWGDVLPVEADEVDQNEPRAAAFDRLDTDPPVIGLVSGVAEWTSSLATIVPVGEDARGKRVIRGGDASVLSGNFGVTEKGRDPRAKIILTHNQKYRGLGFRCGRSFRPRLNPEDFIQTLPKQQSASAE